MNWSSPLPSEIVSPEPSAVPNTVSLPAPELTKSVPEPSVIESLPSCVVMVLPAAAAVTVKLVVTPACAERFSKFWYWPTFTLTLSSTVEKSTVRFTSTPL